MVGRRALMLGGSRSTRPVSKRPPGWVVYQPEEVKALVISLAREGKTPSEIGNILRDEHGIPLVEPIVGGGILEILREAQMAPKLPENLQNLISRAANIRRHLERHPKDYSNKRDLHIAEAKIYKLAKYYKRKGLLPPDWEYRPGMITF